MNFMGVTINNIAHYIVQLQIENGTEQVGMDPAKLCWQCLGLEKELAKCRVLAKAVECKLEVEIQENTQLQTQVGELWQGVDPQGPSAGTGQWRMLQETVQLYSMGSTSWDVLTPWDVLTQMLNEKGVSTGHWPMWFTSLSSIYSHSLPINKGLSMNCGHTLREQKKDPPTVVPKWAAWAGFATHLMVHDISWCWGQWQFTWFTSSMSQTFPDTHEVYQWAWFAPHSSHWWKPRTALEICQ